MNLAREINEKLDKIIELRQCESKETQLEMFPVNPYAEEVNVLEKELNKLTNNGQNCRDLFTNQYYINDLNHPNDYGTKKEYGGYTYDGDSFTKI